MWLLKLFKSRRRQWFQRWICTFNRKSVQWKPETLNSFSSLCRLLDTLCFFFNVEVITSILISTQMSPFPSGLVPSFTSTPWACLHSLLGLPKWPGLELLGLLFSRRQKESFCTHHSQLPKDTLHLPVLSKPISWGTLGRSSQRWKRKLLSKKVSYSSYLYLSNKRSQFTPFLLSCR